jgi:DNA-binding MarR family transcriptional regulator
LTNISFHDISSGVPSAQLTDADYGSLAEFRHQLRRFLAFSEVQARAVGLNPQQHQLLLAVRGFAAQPPTVGALADRLVLRHHSAVELVDRLERRGLVRRVQSAEDARRVLVHLTAAGARVLRRLSVEHREELRRTGPDLLQALLAVLGARDRRRPRASNPGRGPS